MPASAKDDLTKDLKSLSLSGSRKNPSKQPIADSWEDEDDEDVAPQDWDEGRLADDEHFDDESTALPPPIIPKLSAETPYSSSLSPARSQFAFAPDGTPLSPALASGTAPPPNTPTLGADGERRRPEKTTAPAARMIAGALGVRAPKKTEEQRQYEKAVRDKEAKRRDEERERKKRDEAERERLTKEAWDG